MGKIDLCTLHLHEKRENRQIVAPDEAVWSVGWMRDKKNGGTLRALINRFYLLLLSWNVLLFPCPPLFLHPSCIFFFSSLFSVSVTGHEREREAMQLVAAEWSNEIWSEIVNGSNRSDTAIDCKDVHWKASSLTFLTWRHGNLLSFRKKICSHAAYYIPYYL